jgi:hypothetical protein
VFDLTESEVKIYAWGAEGSERPPVERESGLSAEEHVLRCFKSSARAVLISCVMSEFSVVTLLCKVAVS